MVYRKLKCITFSSKRNRWTHGKWLHTPDGIPCLHRVTECDDVVRYVNGRVRAHTACVRRNRCTVPGADDACLRACIGVSAIIWLVFILACWRHIECIATWLNWRWPKRDVGTNSRRTSVRTMFAENSWKMRIAKTKKKKCTELHKHVE